MNDGVDICLSWVKVTDDDQIPATAVNAGDNTFVARFLRNDEMLPGEVMKDYDCYSLCDAPYTIQGEKKFEVLCETPLIVTPRNDPGYEWVPWSGKTAPEKALIGGSDNGRPLYVARAIVNGAWCCGKYLPGDGKAYFHDGRTGEEVPMSNEFQVLVLKKFYNFTHLSGRGVDICVSWVDAAIDEIPHKAVRTETGDDNPVVSRFLRNGKMRLGRPPTTWHQQLNFSKPSVGGYQVLCETPNPGLRSNDPGDPGYQWFPHGGHTALNHAIIGGICHDKPQFVARVTVDSVWCAGKYQSEKGRASFYQGTKKHKLNRFEILVLNGRTG